MVDNPENPSSHTSQYQHEIPYNDPDEINLLEYVYALVKKKWLILGVAFMGLIGGFIVAKIKGPTYTAKAIIAPREAESQKSPNLSGLGMFGGIVASQLNIGGNASLDKIEIILDSRKFNVDMITYYNLLPLLYKYEFPENYIENYDTVSHRWIVDSLVMPVGNAAGYIKSELLSKQLEKNNTLTMKVAAKDSLFADTLLSMYLRYLDTHLRTSVQQEAKENRDYLEKQLLGVTDPLLRTKIQELIANEVEKMMVVSKEAFQTIDPPFVVQEFKEKKLYPLVFAFGLGFLMVLWVVFQHAFTESPKTEEDKRYIDGIRKELTSVPFLGKKNRD